MNRIGEGIRKMGNDLIEIRRLEACLILKISANEE